MPSLPAPLAARAERWFGRPATVDAVEKLSPGLFRVSFSVSGLRGRPWTPGQEVEFRVDNRNFRHYTPASFDAATGAVDVVFTRGAHGPGSRWASALRPGDDAAVMGPGGGVRFDTGRAALIAGDATTVGLFCGLAAAARAGVTGVVEVPEPDVAATRSLLPGLDVVAAEGVAGEAVSRWLSRWVTRRSAPADAPPRAYLAGDARTLAPWRSQLTAAGHPRRDVVTKPYWSPGKAGL
ncbi:MAG: siderophore-interacting protein [Kineosporiaceae bacterium]